ncbi:phosphatase PAP2 family protein [Nakamurella sp.]|uniref:phosphatase PAP2 family protein n=1 Tax=Nakamurella sp. TaxID=1869182 RepID=UPI00378437BC
MDPNLSVFLPINAFTRDTPWLQGPMLAIAQYGVVVFVVLLGVGWWVARQSGDDARQAAAIWAPIGTLLAVALNQPLAALIGEPRPVVAAPGALILLPGAGDPGMPSDHATMAGAVTVGLFLVSRRLGAASAAAALLLAFSRVYVGAHFPFDVLAGLLTGAAVSLLGYLGVRTWLIRLVQAVERTRLRPLLTARRA